MLQTLCPSPTESNNDHTSNMYFSTKNVNRYSVPNYQIRHDKCAREIRYISETTACSTASFKKAPPFKKIVRHDFMFTTISHKWIALYTLSAFANRK